MAEKDREKDDQIESKEESEQELAGTEEPVATIQDEHNNAKIRQNGIGERNRSGHALPKRQVDGAPDDGQRRHHQGREHEQRLLQADIGAVTRFGTDAGDERNECLDKIPHHTPYPLSQLYEVRMG